MVHIEEWEHETHIESQPSVLGSLMLEDVDADAETRLILAESHSKNSLNLSPSSFLAPRELN